MKIELLRISTEQSDERCYVHARGAIRPDGFGIITMQKLELAGSDVFYGIEMIKTRDGGKSFSSPTACEGLKRRYFPDGSSEVICDVTPYFHKKSGKIIATGHLAHYGSDPKAPDVWKEKGPVYAIYDESRGDFKSFRQIKMPKTEDEIFFAAGAGCTQIYEEEDGELLIPYYTRAKDNLLSDTVKLYSGVMRCSFDGEEIRIINITTPITTEVPRGLGEPSITKFGGEYLVALRNDRTGYVAKSRDGVNIEEITELCFDDGENLGNYNTQQHWLLGGGRVWLVYTRRAENNNHVFRHRAPLFIAEFDPKTLRVKRATEKIAVPERGARLGNFGCQSFSEEVGYVFAAEWMQGNDGLEGCRKYGSDNSIFVSKIIYE